MLVFLGAFDRAGGDPLPGFDELPHDAPFASVA
jgi:hypothetical protein